MFEDNFASYNLVKPKNLDSDFFNGTDQYQKDDLYDFIGNEYDYNYPWLGDASSIKNSSIEIPKTKVPDKPKTKVPDPIPTTERAKQVVSAKNYKGSAEFEKHLAEAIKINPEVQKYAEFLRRTAQKESGFNSNIQNGFGAPYYGYFQMGQKEIQSTTGTDVNTFRNNPVQQILGAVELYKKKLATLKKIGAYDLGKQRGYTDDTLVRGAWLAGAGGVNKYLRGAGNPSDKHWSPDGKQGIDVGTLMAKYNVGEY